MPTPRRRPRTFFRLTAVFDRSQVDELPPPAEPAPLDPPAAAEIDGDELAPWLEPLIALAAKIGSTVAFESIASGAEGFYRPRTKAIVVEVAHSRTGASRRSCTSSRTPSDWATAI